MRSTGFVIVSILLHVGAVASLALMPRQTMLPHGDQIEVNVGEDADQAGVENAETALPEALPPQKQGEPEAKPAPRPTALKAAPVKPAVEKVSKPQAKASEPTATKPVAAAAKVETTQAPDELDPAIEEEKPVPVKETAPAGVVAATDEESKHEDKADDQTEAESQDAVQGSQDPSPVGVSEQPVEDGELTKGGATKQGAVSYLELKQLVGNKAPAYPVAARRERRQGELELLYRVTKEGRVADVQIAKSSGHEDLDREAVRAISKFQFVPGQEGWARHPVAFTLKGTDETLPSRLRTSSAQTE